MSEPFYVITVESLPDECTFKRSNMVFEEVQKL